MKDSRPCRDLETCKGLDVDVDVAAADASVTDGILSESLHAGRDLQATLKRPHSCGRQYIFREKLRASSEHPQPETEESVT